jgi:hypothetical protein
MTSRNFALLAAVILAIVALAHLIRAVRDWPVIINTTDIPVWVSWVAFIVAGVLAILGFRVSRG